MASGEPLGSLLRGSDDSSPNGAWWPSAHRSAWVPGCHPGRIGGLTSSACGAHDAAPSSGSTQSASRLLPPSTDPAPWVDASTAVPTVTTTTNSVVTPFRADVVKPRDLGSP